jgi:hypothetical protein
MKNILSTIRYVFKNLHVVGLFALPAAVMLGLKYNNTNFMGFLFNLSDRENEPLLNIYRNFSLFPSLSVWGVLGFIALLTLSSCLLFSYTERHMKFGIRSFLKSFRSVNYALGVLFPALLVIIGIEELFSFLTALFINLFGLSASPVISVVIPLVFLLMMLAMFFLYTMLMMWVPVKMVTGYTHKDSLRYSIRLSQGRQVKFILGVAAPFLLVTPLLALTRRFFPAGIVNVAVFTLLYALVIAYIEVFLMLTYFDITGTERKDIEKKLFGRRF